MRSNSTWTISRFKVFLSEGISIRVRASIQGRPLGLVLEESHGLRVL